MHSSLLKCGNPSKEKRQKEHPDQEGSLRVRRLLDSDKYKQNCGKSLGKNPLEIKQLCQAQDSSDISFQQSLSVQTFIYI